MTKNKTTSCNKIYAQRKRVSVYEGGG